MTVTMETDNRFQNFAQIGWFAACNVDLIDMGKSIEFIMATWMDTDAPHGNETKNCKLQWRRAGGSWTDVGADTEVRWGTGTNLVDGAAMTSGESSNCYTWDRGIESEGDNACAIRADSGSRGEALWALGFGSGAQDEQEYEIKIVNTDDTLEAILQGTVTTVAAAAANPAPDEKLINTKINRKINARIN